MLKKILLFAFTILCESYIILKRVDSKYNLGLYNIIHGRINLIADDFFATDRISLAAAILFLAVLIVVLVYITITKHVNIQLSVRNSKSIWIRLGRLLSYSAIAIVGLIMFTNVFFIYKHQSAVIRMREIFDHEKTIVHACGEYEGEPYTNSYEALVNCYDSGNRVSEIDFLFTSDDKLVCAHDLVDGWAYGISSDGRLSEEEFLDSRFLDTLTTMGMEKLAKFIREHRDFYVVTDIKDRNIDGCRYIAENYPDVADNFIIQIYHISEYDPVHDLGFENIIYTLYMTEYEEKKPEVLAQNVKDKDLMGITFGKGMLKYEDWFDSVRNMGIPLMIHTVDDVSEIQNAVDLGLLVYTDNTDNEWIRR